MSREANDLEDKCPTGKCPGGRGANDRNPNIVPLSIGVSFYALFQAT